MIEDMQESVRDIIGTVVRSEFGDGKIVDVRVDEDVDFDGDDVYRVMIIFDSSSGSLDPKKMSGLARHIRAVLEDNVYRFPILSFISKSEAGKFGSAAA